MFDGLQSPYFDPKGKNIRPAPFRLLSTYRRKSNGDRKDPDDLIRHGMTPTEPPGTWPELLKAKRCRGNCHVSSTALNPGSTRHRWETSTQ
jgi:hypothetical protein